MAHFTLYQSSTKKVLRNKGKQRDTMKDNPITDGHQLTLEPLRIEGPDALRHDHASSITHVALTEIELAWNNRRHEVLVRRADDIFASAAEHGAHKNPIPKGAKIVQAQITFAVKNAPERYVVQIRPPATIKFPSGSYTTHIRAWLLNSHLLTTAKTAASKLLLAAALAFAQPTLLEDDSPGDLQERSSALRCAAP